MLRSLLLLLLSLLSLPAAAEALYNPYPQVGATQCTQLFNQQLTQAQKVLKRVAGQSPAAGMPAPKPASEVLQALWDTGLSFPVEIDQYGIGRTTNAAIVAKMQECQGMMSDAPKYQACVMPLAAATQAFGDFQALLLESSGAYFAMQGTAFTCRNVADMAVIEPEKVRFLGGGEPDYAPDRQHFRTMLATAERAEEISAAMAAVVASLGSVGGRTLEPKKLAPLLAALPAVMDSQHTVSDAEIDAHLAAGRAAAESDPQLIAVKASMQAGASRAKPSPSPAPTAPAAGGGATAKLAAMQQIAGGLTSGSLQQVARGLTPFLPEDSPVRAGIDCATAILDRDFKGAFVAARKLVPADSKLRAALEMVPV